MFKCRVASQVFWLLIFDIRMEKSSKNVQTFEGPDYSSLIEVKEAVLKIFWDGRFLFLALHKYSYIISETFVQFTGTCDS